MLKITNVMLDFVSHKKLILEDMNRKVSSCKNNFNKNIKFCLNFTNNEIFFAFREKRDYTNAT